MFIEESQIESLIALQQADMDLLAVQKQAADLPQRAALAEISQKKKAIREKYAQVSKMSDSLTAQIERKAEEERLLKEKLAFIQGKIDDAAGNFRQIESLTKDLTGMKNRLDAAETEHLALEEKAAGIDSMVAQIEGALKVLADQEAAQKKSFEAEAGRLSAVAKEATERKKSAAAGLPREVVSKYVDVQKSCGGVAVAQLQKGACSRCRADLTARMPTIRKQAPLGTCPACGRMLIIEE